MYGTFWALVPPIIAIILALITKEAYSSLFIGIVVGALFCCDFAPVATLDTIVNDGFVKAIVGNAGIFLFLVILGVIVALVNSSGGSAAFGRWAAKNIKSRVGAQIATFVLGVLIFIDDYFNCLTVGTVMRPVTDTHRISRPKLAYLIDATAAPVCMIAPISSWAAAVSGVASDLDTGMSGIELFVRAIPFNFYSLLTFVFIIALVVMKFDYGPMRGHEELARLKGELGALDTETAEEENPKGRVIDLIFPVIILIITCVIGMIYVGGFFGVDAWGGTECAGDFVAAFGNTNAFIGLPWGGLIALIVTIIYLVARRVISFKEAMACVPKGFIAMVPPIIILTMAVSLKAMTTSLGAAEFVRDVMAGAAQGLYSMLPAVIFVVACILAFASGTSWGTFGILIPIVTAIFPATSELLFIGISACLAGAVCGDHCSPISDTTIMSSAGAQCDHVTHVSTQLPYALTVACISFVNYIIAGFVRNAAICLITGVILTVGTLLVIRAVERGRHPAEG
jgi:tetracycline resistance efflux pump